MEVVKLANKQIKQTTTTNKKHSNITRGLYHSVKLVQFAFKKAPDYGAYFVHGLKNC